MEEISSHSVSTAIPLSPFPAAFVTSTDDQRLHHADPLFLRRSRAGRRDEKGQDYDSGWSRHRRRGLSFPSLPSTISTDLAHKGRAGRGNARADRGFFFFSASRCMEGEESEAKRCRSPSYSRHFLFPLRAAHSRIGRYGHTIMSSATFFLFFFFPCAGALK